MPNWMTRFSLGSLVFVWACSPAPANPPDHGTDGQPGDRPAGTEGDPASTEPDPEDPAPDGSTGEAPGLAPNDCDDDLLATLPRYLTGPQLANALRDLLGVEVEEPFGTSNPGTAPFVSVTSATFDRVRPAYVATVEQALAQVVIEPLLECDPHTVSDDDARDCVEDFLDSFVERAWHRGVSQQRRQELLAVFDQVEGSLAERFWVVLREILLADDFFLLEPGVVGDSDRKLIELDAHRLASRLSFFLWNSVPDDQLVARARDGSLLDDEVLAAEADRLLSDPRAGRAIGDLYEQLMATGTIEKTSVETWESSVEQSMQRSFRLFVADAVLGPEGGTLPHLLTSSTTYFDGPLAEMFSADIEGPAPEGASFAAVVLDPNRRFGLIGQPAFLAAHGGPGERVPWVARGARVAFALQCEPLPPPPEAASDLPGGDVSEGRRELWQQVIAEDQCMACHAIPDPITFSLDHYDSLGRYRESIDGAPIDDTIEGHPLLGDFEGLVGLVEALEQTSTLSQCAVERYATFAWRHRVSRCWVDPIAQEFDEHGRDLRWLMQRIVLAPHFRSLWVDALWEDA